MNSVSLTITGDLPVSLPVAKAWLRIDHDADDELISQMISEAVGEIERRTGRQLRTSTGVLKLSEFPATERTTARRTATKIPTGREPIVIPCPPLKSITSVTYIDETDAEQTLAVVPNLDSLPGLIYPADGETWPTASVNAADPITILYACGQPPDDSQSELIGCIRIMLDLEFHDLTPIESARLEKRRDSIIKRWSIRDGRMAGITRN